MKKNTKAILSAFEIKSSNKIEKILKQYPDIEEFFVKIYTTKKDAIANKNWGSFIKAQNNEEQYILELIKKELNK